MERYTINQLPLSTSGSIIHTEVLDSIFKGRRGYYVGEEEEGDFIVTTRRRFQYCVMKYHSPGFNPTIYRNHSDRSEFLASEHKNKGLDARNPPKETFVTFKFADDIFANIVIKFSEEYPVGKQKPYKFHSTPAKIVCLKKEYSAEDAFEEVLTYKMPCYYSDDIEEFKQSRYVEPDKKKWNVREGCMAEYSRVDDNEVQFIVDVSVIYPDDIWSTATVTCYDCGKFAELALCDAVKVSAKSEIWNNIVQNDIEKEVAERERCVIRLPTTSSQHSLCAFREGLLGFTTLTNGTFSLAYEGKSSKPGLFVRVRITYYTNERSRFGHVIHKHK